MLWQYKKISLQLLLLDEEACGSRTFQPSRVGWILSSLTQKQAVACAQKSKEKETSHLRWSDKNGEQKIVLHPAYLAAVYSEEDSPRAVFHHAGVWQPGPPSSYSLRTSGIGRRHICWRPSISHRVCTHHFQGRMRSWETLSRSIFPVRPDTGKYLEWQLCGQHSCLLSSTFDSPYLTVILKQVQGNAPISDWCTPVSRLDKLISLTTLVRVVGRSQVLMAQYFSIWTLLTVLLPRLQVHMTVSLLSKYFLHRLYAYTIWRRYSCIEKEV